MIRILRILNLFFPLCFRVSVFQSNHVGTWRATSFSCHPERSEGSVYLKWVFPRLFTTLWVKGEKESSIINQKNGFIACTFGNSPYICTALKQGALAHLARALDWQSKGDEFESRMLHRFNEYVN